MNNADFEALLQWAQEALAHAEGRKVSGAIVHHAVDVRAIRRRLGMSQPQLAAAFGFSVATVRQCEQGRRTPRGPARTLLVALAHEPEAVLRALAIEAGASARSDRPSGAPRAVLPDRR